MCANLPAEARCAQLAPHVQKAVEAHRAFLERFEKDGAPPERAEEESEAAYLQSRFQVARAHGKLESSESVRLALEEYTSLDAYLRKHKVEGMAAEADACAEMLRLLPHKLSQLSAR